MSQIEEIKSKLDIVEILREYLPLKQAGANWKANCPFHHEKTPSFMVSQERQSWHCFGCNIGGDVFEFVKRIEGVEFPEALRILARRAGVELKRQDYDPLTSTKKTTLLNICELSAEFFHRTLLQSQQAQVARDYLKQRQLNETTIRQWQLGYTINNWDTLTNFLRQKNFSDQDIIDAGLSIRGDKGIYDRFRERIMFPISDVHGTVVGFTGRLLNADAKEAKYVNTPQTLIYNKSQVVFGLDKAKDAIREQGFAVIVEGNMDVIASHQVGITNVVASSGTALTVEQLKLLKRYAQTLIFAFDSDAAGETAARRGIELALSLELNVKLAKVIQGKDPDECIKINPELWKQTLKEAQPIMEYYFAKSFANFNLQNVEDKKRVVKELLPIIQIIGSDVEKMHWLQVLGQKINMQEQMLLDLLRKNSKTASFKKPNASTDVNVANGVGATLAVAQDEQRAQNKQSDMDRYFLALLTLLPDKIAEITNHIPIEALSSSEDQDLYKIFLDCYNQNQQLDPQTLVNLAKDQAAVISRLQQIQILAADLKDQIAQETINIDLELQKTTNNLEHSFIQRQLLKLQEELKNAESANDQNLIKSLMEEYNNLNQKLARLS